MNGLPARGLCVLLLTGMVVVLTVSPATAEAQWPRSQIAKAYVPADEATITPGNNTSFKSLQAIALSLAGHSSRKLRKDLLGLSKAAHAYWATSVTAGAKKLIAVATTEANDSRRVAIDLGVNSQIIAFIRAATTTTAAAPAQGAYFACTGSTPDGVDITYGTDSSTLNGASSVPWSAMLPLDPSANYYNVDAQLNGDGTVTCTTTVVYKEGGSTLTATKTGTAQGSYNIASPEICSDSNGGWVTC